MNRNTDENNEFECRTYVNILALYLVNRFPNTEVLDNVDPETVRRICRFCARVTPIVTDVWNRRDTEQTRRIA